ncbi:MAG: YjjW family glycine radical enzyme activase [Lachnospiraceae bacterium]|nr:YjjW family glycine radical enzyme activase [Lachnospiraceae bacterium]
MEKCCLTNQKYPVNQIIPFSCVDGPGNRTAVFLQGCNIDCRYCHNPETRRLCVHCGICVEKCPVQALYIEDGRVKFAPEKCVRCDTCIRLCPHNASPRIRRMTAQEVFDEVRQYAVYISGVTVSGGECTLYPEFLTELFSLCKEQGLNTLLDSNGMISYESMPEVMAVTDGVMLDIKAFDSEEHKRVTGFDNAQVLQNAACLADTGKLAEIRTVMVPGLNNGEAIIQQIADFLKPHMDIASLRYKLIAFRQNGVREQYRHYPQPDAEYMSRMRDCAQQAGFRNIIII